MLGADEAIRNGAELIVVILAARFLAGDFLNGIVFQDPPTRLVQILCELFPPCCNCNDQGRIILLLGPQFQTLPGLCRVGVVLRRIFQVGHFLLHPWQAAAGFQFFPHDQIGVAQVSDVAKGINELLLGQRPAHPVCELAGFVDLAPQHALDQIVVGNRVAIAERHSRDLCVENWPGRVADQAIEYFDVLTGCVEHFHAIVGRDEVQEGANVQILGKRVDKTFHAGGRSLHKAEFRPIGRFPMELGVNADKVAFGQLSAEIFEGRLLSNGSQGVVSHRGLAYRIARTNARGECLP